MDTLAKEQETTDQPPVQHPTNIYRAIRGSFEQVTQQSGQSRTEQEQQRHETKMRLSKFTSLLLQDDYELLQRYLEEHPELKPEIRRQTENFSQTIHGNSQLQVESRRFRDKYQPLEEAKQKELLERIKSMRKNIIENGQVSQDEIYQDKELFSGTVYRLSSDDGTLTLLAEDLPDDPEKLQANYELISISAEDEAGMNSFFFSVNSDGTCSLTMDLGGVKPGDPDLKFDIGKQEMSTIRIFEYSLIDHYLNMAQELPLQTKNQ